MSVTHGQISFSHWALFVHPGPVLHAFQHILQGKQKPLRAIGENLGLGPAGTQEEIGHGIRIRHYQVQLLRRLIAGQIVYIIQMDVGLLLNPVSHPVVLVGRNALVGVVYKYGQGQFLLQREHHVLR